MQKNSKASDATVQEITAHIIRWFSLASDRAGGHKARAEKAAAKKAGNRTKNTGCLKKKLLFEM